MISLLDEKTQDTHSTCFHDGQKDQWLQIMTSWKKSHFHKHREDPVEPFHYADNILLYKPGGSGPSPTVRSLCVPCPCALPGGSWPAPLLCRTLRSPGQQWTCSIWTHRKAKACMPKAVLQPTAPNEFIPGLLDGGVTHRLEATDL